MLSLLAALLKSYVSLVLICRDKSCFSYDFSVGHWAADLLLAVDDCASATSHRPHIGCQFSVVAGF